MKCVLRRSAITSHRSAHSKKERRNENDRHWRRMQFPTNIAIAIGLCFPFRRIWRLNGCPLQHMQFFNTILHWTCARTSRALHVKHRKIKHMITHQKKWGSVRLCVVRQRLAHLESHDLIVYYYKLTCAFRVMLREYAKVGRVESHLIGKKTIRKQNALPYVSKQRLCIENRIWFICLDKHCEKFDKKVTIWISALRVPEEEEEEKRTQHNVQSELQFATYPRKDTHTHDKNLFRFSNSNCPHLKTYFFPLCIHTEWQFAVPMNDCRFIYLFTHSIAVIVRLDNKIWIRNQSSNSVRRTPPSLSITIQFNFHRT